MSWSLFISAKFQSFLRRLLLAGKLELIPFSGGHSPWLGIWPDRAVPPISPSHSAFPIAPSCGRRSEHSCRSVWRILSPHLLGGNRHCRRAAAGPLKHSLRPQRVPRNARGLKSCLTSQRTFAAGWHRDRTMRAKLNERARRASCALWANSRKVRRKQSCKSPAMWSKSHLMLWSLKILLIGMRYAAVESFQRSAIFEWSIGFDLRYLQRWRDRQWCKISAFYLIPISMNSQFAIGQKKKIRDL